MDCDHVSFTIFLTILEIKTFLRPWSLIKNFYRCIAHKACVYNNKTLNLDIILIIKCVKFSQTSHMLIDHTESNIQLHNYAGFVTFLRCKMNLSSDLSSILRHTLITYSLTPYPSCHTSNMVPHCQFFIFYFLSNFIKLI